MQVRSVRAEIDKREAQGHLVAGRNGAGGTCPMRTPAQRAQRQTAVVRFAFPSAILSSAFAKSLRTPQMIALYTMRFTRFWLPRIILSQDVSLFSISSRWEAPSCLGKRAL